MADPWTGEVIAEAGEKLTRERAQELAARGVNDVFVDVDGTTVRVFANNMIDPKPYLDFDPEEIGLTERVRFTVFQGPAGAVQRRGAPGTPWRTPTTS